MLTNDDGIRAPGIVALHGVLADPDGHLGGPVRGADGVPASVFPVAPLTVQSATSHGVTFHEPLMVQHVAVHERMEGLAVDARPADCVKLALSTLWPDRYGEGERPDLVVSGMNAGANCGINVIYSGTVAAALEAAFLGVPSIAVSLMLGAGEADFAAGAAHARRAIEAILADGPLEPHTCLSVNIPVTERGDPDRASGRALRVCRMNTHGLVDAYERRVSPAGHVYYWPNRSGMDFHATDPGTDVDELLAGAVTVTPLQFDLTRQAQLPEWRGRLGGRRV